MQVVMCPRDQCHALYVGINKPDHASTFPSTADLTKVAPEIVNYYPEFLDIYKQSSIAEAEGLSDLAGMGYRKSVEFLIKLCDIDLFPDNKDQILREPAAKSINRLSLYPQIRDLAKGIAWIGNDETHMFQKHPNYSIPEMKDFIYALSHLIVALNIAKDKAANLLNEPPKK